MKNDPEFGTRELDHDDKHELATLVNVYVPGDEQEFARLKTNEYALVNPVFPDSKPPLNTSSWD